MVNIYHQFHERAFYQPNWEIKYLFIGTFNPLGGEKVNYYYGRKKNQTWKLISTIFCDEFDPENFQTFIEKLKKYKIGCIDMIDSVISPEERVENIIGKGYRDTAIINRSVKRLYNTNFIKGVIEKNPGIKVFSTWGKGPALKEWNDEVGKIESIIPLVSPSFAAKVPKGSNKFQYMLLDWQQKISANP